MYVIIHLKEYDIFSLSLFHLKLKLKVADSISHVKQLLSMKLIEPEFRMCINMISYWKQNYDIITCVSSRRQHASLARTSIFTSSTWVFQRFRLQRIRLQLSHLKRILFISGSISHVTQYLSMKLMESKFRICKNMFNYRKRSYTIIVDMSSRRQHTSLVRTSIFSATFSAFLPLWFTFFLIQ